MTRCGVDQSESARSECAVLLQLNSALVLGKFLVATNARASCRTTERPVVSCASVLSGIKPGLIGDGEFNVTGPRQEPA